jgi:hypothetical protein
MMAMAVMAMPMMMMMTMAMPVVPMMAVMAVASTVSTVAAMPTVTVTTTGECLTRDGQRSSGQRQSSNRRRNDLVDLRHGRLLGWAERGSPCDDPLLEALAAMRCDQDHAIGRIARLV